MDRFALSLAGYRIAVEMGDGDERAHIDARFGGFRSEAGAAPDFHVRIDRVAALGIEQPADTQWPGARGVRVSPTCIRFERRGERVEIDLAERTVRATVDVANRGSMEAVLDPTSLDTPLRLLLSCALPRDGGLLMHACGYADARGAVVFPAVSGGGKTTTTHKLPVAHVLSDDQVAVRHTEAGWRAYALPFIGLYGRATSQREATLRAVAFLGQGASPRLTRLTPARSLARVMTCAPWFVRDDRAIDALLGAAEQLAREVPCHTLDLALDTAMAPWLDTLLG